MSGLPGYLPLLSAYHAAQRETIREAIAQLPLRPGDKVLDVPCGDGFYAHLLAERVAPHGRVVAADHSSDLLALARGKFAREEISFEVADAYELPFSAATFDLVWCAQSLISLRDPAAALKEMLRVLTPRGCVAIWENDELHQTLVPWPAELEIALHEAERSAQAKKRRSLDALVAGRFVRRYLHSAGFTDIVRRTYATDHQHPLSDNARTLADCWLASLTQRLRPCLGDRMGSLFDDLAQPDSPGYLPHRPHFEMVLIDILTVGRRPA
jgi:ubiquinone/menaquinone biosynthesis C-methylase UbiE